MRAPNRPLAIWPVSLARIESMVSAHLGPGRVRGKCTGSMLQPSGFHVSGEACGPLELVANRPIL